MLNEYYKHPYKGDVKEIKSGFNWAAFLFSFLWAAVKGFWAIAIGDILLRAFILGLHWILLPPYAIVVAIFYGVKGNKMNRDRLLIKGYKRMDKEIY